MKKYVLIILGGLIILQSCGKFGDINVDPTKPTKVPPNYLLNNAIQTSSFPGQMLSYENVIVQYGMAPYSGVWIGGNTNQANTNNTNGVWVNYYENPVKQLVDATDSTNYDKLHPNGYQMCRIWKAYVFMILTDTYGDVPYLQAGQGYLKKIDQPIYDSQESIYTGPKGIINELTDATSKLDASKPLEVADILYTGDVAKWKKLGYSLLLRAGMRLSKVNPTLAKNTVAVAVAGGVFSSNSDNAVFNHSSTYPNGLNAQLNATEKCNYFMNNTLVDTLKKSGDPRLGAIAVVYDDPCNSDFTKAGKHDTLRADQKGLFLGLVQNDLSKNPNWTGSLNKYSQFNRESIANVYAPNFYITYAQTLLLLAEASQRGWVTVTGKDVAELYKEGVIAHMQQLLSYGPKYGIISQAQIDSYLNANPFDISKALEQINYQYWVACIGNPSESWANVRRSGFPKLYKNPYPSQDVSPAGDIIHRLIYPTTEPSLNGANLAAAIARQGPDRLDTHVWWDK